MSQYDIAMGLIYCLGCMLAAGMMDGWRIKLAAIVCCLCGFVALIAAATFGGIISYQVILCVLIACQVLIRCWVVKPTKSTMEWALLIAGGFGLLAWLSMRSEFGEWAPLMALAAAIPAISPTVCIVAAMCDDWRAACLFTADCLESILGVGALLGLCSWTTAGEASYAMAVSPWALSILVGLFLPGGLGFCVGCAHQGHKARKGAAEAVRW